MGRYAGIDKLLTFGWVLPCWLLFAALGRDNLSYEPDEDRMPNGAPRDGKNDVGYFIYLLILLIPEYCAEWKCNTGYIICIMYCWFYGENLLFSQWDTQVVSYN